MTAPRPDQPRHRPQRTTLLHRRRHGGVLPPVGADRSQRTRNPNRWLLYGFGLGVALGWAIDLVGVGIIVGLFTGMMLRIREQEESAEEAAQMADLTPRQDDILH